jgi:hypothetical protein
MSLILFNSFFPIEQRSGTPDIKLSNAARSSMSRFISEQLNRLSPGIEGLDFEVNLESYESGTKDVEQAITNLEIGLSQSLFDQRLTFKISGNVYLENNDEESDEILEYLDDIVVEYELTEDGGLQLVGFRKNDFDELSQGKHIKTGIGVIFIKDFDNLKDLFYRDKEKKGTR